MTATSRGDRLIIDDPHPTSAPEEKEAARAAFLSSVRDRVAEGGPVVIIISRPRRGDHT